MFYRSNEINEFLDTTDISEVITGETTDKDFKFCKCPFCGKDSFLIDTLRKTYVCLDCKKGGNTISFLLKDSSIDTVLPLKRSDEVKDDRLKKIIFYMMKYYEGKVNESICQYYLKERHLDETIVKTYHLGYSGPFGSELFDFLLKKGFLKDELIKSKLFGEKKDTDVLYYDKFYDRLIFPIFDRNNEPIGFGGRTLKNSSAKYLNSAENIIFHKGENLYGYQLALKSKKSYIILCEGNIDMIMMQQNGFLNAAASLGTALTNEQCEMVSKDFKHVILAYDNDDAGKKATIKAIYLLNQYNIKPNVLDLSPYKDPDEFIKQKGKNEFLKRVNHSIPGSLFMKRYISSLPLEEKIPMIEEILERK